jgi:hypothetical protein
LKLVNGTGVVVIGTSTWTITLSVQNSILGDNATVDSTGTGWLVAKGDQVISSASNLDQRKKAGNAAPSISTAPPRRPRSCANSNAWFPDLIATKVSLARSTLAKMTFAGLVHQLLVTDLPLVGNTLSAPEHYRPDQLSAWLPGAISWTEAKVKIIAS